MKFEIEIKEEDWETLDSNPKVQILLTTKLNPDYKIKTLADILGKKFPVEIIDNNIFETSDKNGYFYGYGYIPFIKEGYVHRSIFRTKTLLMYQIITLYSKRIYSLFHTPKKRIY